MQNFLSARDDWIRRCEMEEASKTSTITNNKHQPAANILAISPSHHRSRSGSNNDKVLSKTLPPPPTPASNDYSLLLTEILKGNEASVSALFTFRNAAGDTLFHILAREGNIDVLWQCLQLAVRRTDGNTLVNAKNHRKDTALHVAVLCGDRDVALLLLGAGADPYKKNLAKNNALHIACTSGEKDIVGLMLTHKRASPSTLAQVNKAGLTPLQVAKQCGYVEIEAMINNAWRQSQNVL